MELFNELKSNNQKLNGDQQQLFELYNALIQYFNNYLKPFFVSGKQEEMQNAILDMEKLGQSSQIIIHTLSAYFLGKIYLNYENQPEKGLVYFQWLSSEYPENKKFGELLLESGKKP